MRVGFRFKGMFFDSPAVIKAVDDATYRALVRFGQYVRKVARHSIKTRPGPSAPGEPPHNQTGVLKGFIFYGFDPGSRSAVSATRYTWQSAPLTDGQTYRFTIRIATAPWPAGLETHNTDGHSATADSSAPLPPLLSVEIM
jgi:hypothetical protein